MVYFRQALTQMSLVCDNLITGTISTLFWDKCQYNNTISKDFQTMQTYQTTLTDTEYNGWTNYETWNVGLWLGSDEGLYDLARRALDFDHLKEMLMCYGSETTGDGVRWDDPKVNGVEIDEMLEEL